MLVLDRNNVFIKSFRFLLTFKIHTIVTSYCWLLPYSQRSQLHWFDLLMSPQKRLIFGFNCFKNWSCPLPIIKVILQMYYWYRKLFSECLNPILIHNSKMTLKIKSLSSLWKLNTKKFTFTWLRFIVLQKCVYAKLGRLLK